jgi:glycosyltransferase involved in cell wall biosynthesis
MDPKALTTSFRLASQLVASSWNQNLLQLPLLYYQTSVLLPYAPTEYDVAVTHHSPFVEHVTQLLGAETAQRAFNWDHPKADHLAIMQSQALRVLATQENVHCLEISILQELFLRECGVPQRRIHRIPQPVGGSGVNGQLPSPLERVVVNLPSEHPNLAAVTAVSRLDYFKNVELFVDGCCLALRNGDLQCVIVVAGFTHDEERERLRSRVPADLAASFTFIPRLERGLLIGSLFPRLAGKAVFVCSSRFDLVPYTVLEAARVNLCTVVPNHGRIGVAQYLPDQYQFDGSPPGLATLLANFARDRCSMERFQQTASLILQATSDETFLRSFADFCTQL